MFARWQVLNKKNVRRPWKVRWILRTGNDKALIRQIFCWLDEQVGERFLSIRRVGAEIGKRSAICPNPRGWPVDIRVDTAVERSRRPRSELVPQSVKRAATGETKNYVELGQTIRVDVWDRLPASHTRQSHRCIEVVK